MLIINSDGSAQVLYLSEIELKPHTLRPSDETLKYLSAKYSTPVRALGKDSRQKEGNLTEMVGQK